MCVIARRRRVGSSVPGAGLGAGVAVRRGRGRRGAAGIRRAHADARVARPARARRAAHTARHRAARVQSQ